ncbi:MAG: DUF1800 domain-containing protein [Acidobacteriota bacterium]|nr:DUF1800 domain-containing protein [Acidobacteriota bacterium]
MTGKLVLTSALGIALLLTGSPLSASRKKKTVPTPAAASMDEQQRAIHALNRFTFGARPGDVDRVLATGVNNWFEQQLSPQTIDDSRLDARLAPLHTVRMSSRELARSFPSDAILKAVAEGKLPMPTEAPLKAVYTAGITRLNEKQDKKNAKFAESADLLGQSPEEMNAGQKERRQEARDHARARALDLMEQPAASRTQTLAAMDPDERRAFWRALSQDDRERLTADMQPEQKELLLSLENPVSVVNGELMQAKLLRAAYSERQLLEVMTDFWFNHFNIYLNKGADRYLITSYERDVIRANALGKFSDLLLATAKSPAMLWYLDNWQSVGPNSKAAGRNKDGKPNQGLNENYAREVMELHTLGVNGGYTQKDVTELARVLTGWTLEEPREGGGYVFRPARHEPGDKVVLGKVFHEDGEREGEAALRMLASQPATAHFICTELAQRFVSDTPPETLVQAMAKTFLDTDGDIKAILRTMFHAPEFWQASEYRAKVKTPLEFTVSAVRATGAGIVRPQGMVDALNRLGMPLYGEIPPTGYSEQAAGWVNSGALLNRINFALALGTGRLNGVQVDVSKLVPAAGDAAQTQSLLEQKLVAGGVSAQTHETIAHQQSTPAVSGRKLDDPPRPPNTGALAGLILGSPEFQRR